jgi:murein peptide amidase A
VTPRGGPYRELEQRWERLCASREDLQLQKVACDGHDRTLLRVHAGDLNRPVIALAAGVHGDEPAGPWALLDLVAKQRLDPRFAYRIWACTNPTGFDAGTRENAEGIDVNRAFGASGGSPEARAILAADGGRTFKLSLDLHEDADAMGFYCYEYGGGEIGRSVIAALDAVGLPIDPLEATFALAGPLDDARCRRERGRVVADAAEEAALLGGLSYSLALARHGAAHAMTFETPSSASQDERRAMHEIAILAAIAALT